MAGVYTEALQQLQAILRISEVDASDCLKACNNDVNHAAEYYLNGDLEKTRQESKWDEAAFTAPREGFDNDTNNWNPGYQIQGNDVLSQGIFEGTKSRPPSRTSFQRFEGDNDTEYAQAIAASMQSIPGAGDFAPQETGITNPSPTNPNFAPAQENKDYDPREWALTTTSAREVVPEPLPPYRKRNPGVPVFLRPAPSSYNLHAAITILHSIPQARAAFIARNYLLADYGRNAKWWNGEEMRSVRVFELEQEGPGVAEAAEEIAEMQRLMAFLGASDRAYGSIDVLSGMPRLRGGDQSALSTFFQSWSAAVTDLCSPDNGHGHTSVFTSQAFQLHTEDDGITSQHFQVLEPCVSPGDVTLYCTLDNVIWTDDTFPAFLKFSDVLCIQLRTETDNQGTAIEIPATFYPDRYTEPWLHLVKDLKARITNEHKIIAQLLAKEARLTSYRDFNLKDLAKVAIDHFKTSLEGSSPAEDAQTVTLLEQLTKSLEVAHSNLGIRKQEAYRDLLNLKRRFTSPEASTSEHPALTKYSLRGLCADPLVFYLLVRSENDTKAEPIKNEQWWRIEWFNGNSEPDSCPFDVSMATLDDALATAKSQGDNILLIYAREDALSVDDPLPGPLKTFVDNDNDAFAAELSPSPATPGKRRRNDSSSPSEELDQGSTKRSSASTILDQDSGSTGSPERWVPFGGAPSRDPPMPSIRDSDDVKRRPSPLGPDAGTVVDREVELPPREMSERGGHVSPLASAFHLQIINVPSTDEHMADMSHVEHHEGQDP